MTWNNLDRQMAAWNSRLVSQIGISEDASRNLATTIAADVRFLPSEAKSELKGVSPVPIDDRISELKAFQGWMDTARQADRSPFVVRAQVIVQNYICFVYLPESCFRTLSKVAPANSTAKKCAQFLSNNPVRAFRNAISHANWTYRGDFKAIIYWARKGDDPSEPLARFEIEQDDISFWQSLSRCVAYAALSNL